MQITIFMPGVYIDYRLQTDMMMLKKKKQKNIV